MDKKYKQVTCSCKTCQEMCKERPCWPTPQESKKLIKNGFAKKLMYDYWAAIGGEDIGIISPAIVGYEGSKAPFWPVGRCVFLDENGLCELHDLGLKPFEGRMADCKNPTKNLHEDTAMTWDTPEGKDVVKLWKNNV